ncbi:hypothetical protein Aple_069560 [Acrocarpospora pleiomorpha]|uniref:Ricin B lectin domain-containing protein n=1 Tax=Acrocarpospora pleiomorpha TaxID=90975 RepID=A0A5M3XRV8_9ACTN|nr:RICIN domain-containing protein [Acrocarpospora pleiomorpha]GES24057.1 hypothetical protein Aple_069560 [Acrocarpospora pleiomorpha]
MKRKHYAFGRVGGMASAALLAAGLCLAATGTAQAAQAGAPEPAAAAALPPTDPALWWIKNSGLTVTAKFGTDAIRTKLWNMPTTINPFYVHVLWHFTPVPSNPGAYFVESHNGGCLDVLNDSKAIGADLAIRQCDGSPSQQWFTPPKNGRWALKNEWSKLYASAKLPIADGRVLTQQFDGVEQELYFDMPQF